ncbi:MAG TPA: ABC transporter ATP-binding protein, partial [Actinomycetota bacterium]|nr:ABC transporter ATP-binding protein [Actinomycetota bacterium]
MSSVSVDQLSVSYNGKPAVHDLSVRVGEGSWVTLIGPNGAGKTTVLRAIAGVVEYSGRIMVGRDMVGSIRRRQLAQLVAYVPQRPVMPASATVMDYVLMGRNPYIAYFATESKEDIEVVTKVLHRLELTALARRPLGSLSGGEAQRAVLARALAQQAPVLLLDEPTSALDVGHQQQVLEL